MRKRLKIEFPIGQFSRPLFCENGDIWVNHRDALYRITNGECHTILEYPSFDGCPAALCPVMSYVYGVTAPVALMNNIYLLAGSARDKKQMIYRFDGVGTPFVICEFAWEYHELVASENMLYLLGEQRVTLLNSDGIIIRHWNQPAAEMKNAFVCMETSVLFLGQGSYLKTGKHSGCAKYPIFQAHDNGTLTCVHMPAMEDLPQKQREYDVQKIGECVFYGNSKYSKRRREMQFRCFQMDKSCNLQQSSFLRFRQNARLADPRWGRASVSKYGLLFTDEVNPPQFHHFQSEEHSFHFLTDVYYTRHRLWFCPLATPERPQVIPLPVNDLTRKCCITLPPLQTADGTIFVTGNSRLDNSPQFLARYRNGKWSFRKFPRFEQWYLFQDTLFATHCWNTGCLYEIPQELSYK